MRTLTVILCLIVFALSGCTGQNEKAVQLASTAILTQQKLAEEQEKSLEQFSNFASTVRTQFQELQKLQERRIENTRQLTRSFHRESRQRIRHETLAQFDEQAFVLLTQELPKAIDLMYWGKINPLADKAKTKRAELAKEALEYPNDPVVRVAALQAEVDYQYLLSVANAYETHIWSNAVQQLTTVRRSLQNEINELITKPNATLTSKTADSTSGKKNGASNNAWSVLDSRIDVVIKSIQTSRKELTNAHKRQLEALQKVQSYINQPKEWQQVLEAFSVTLLNEIVNLEFFTGIFGLSDQDTESTADSENVLNDLRQKATALLNESIDSAKESFNGAVESTMEDVGNITSEAQLNNGLNPLTHY